MKGYEMEVAKLKEKIVTQYEYTQNILLWTRSYTQKTS